ncbi:MAG: T9SS type B sorting domain-containing protein [Bacteroidota bacterium]
MKKFLFVYLLIQSFSGISQEVEHQHSTLHAFVENKGQWPAGVFFKSRIEGGNFWIQQKQFIFQLMDYSSMEEAHRNPKSSNGNDEIPSVLVFQNFIGANEVTNIEKFHPSEAYLNYFIGNKSEHWASNVHSYEEAIMHEFYDGIDLKLIENKKQLKYEFHVQAGSNPQIIKFEYHGHQRQEINKKGELVIHSKLGQIIEEKPYAYQVINGKIVEVQCQFKIEHNQIGFQLGTYDPAAILVIDPVLVFATYSGSLTDNFGMTATYGQDGSAYSGGMIYGNAYPTPNPLAFDINSSFTQVTNPTYGITDAFISKYNSNGTTMLWTTFLGGGNATQGTETAQSMICDANDNLYLYGSTSSIDFPIVGGYQASHAGGSANSNHYFNGVYFTNQGTDIYVAKISANGQNLLASTYMGGSLNDGVNTKVTSGTYNSVAAYDSLTYNYGDQFRGEIMLDPLGNCIVASCSRSTDFPISNAFQSANAGMQDGVVFKLNNSLSTLVWSSYYGGANNDACYSVKVDSSYNVVVVGSTSSNNLQFTAGGYQPSYNGGKTDGFALKLDPIGTSVLQATYLGTPNYDQAFFVEIDRNDNVFVLGQSEGGLFPVVNSTFINPNSSQFVIKLNPLLNTNLNSTVFGNGQAAPNISPAAFLVDICGNIYISGWGANILQSVALSGMPISPGAFQSTAPDGFDFYLLVIEREFGGLLYATYMGGGSADEHVDGGTSRFDKNGVVYQSVCGGCGGFSDFPTTAGAWSNSNLSSNCNNIVFKFDFELIPQADFVADQSLGCATFPVTFDNFSTASDSYLWDFGNGDTSSIIFNPTIIYDTPGIYDVFLYVTDSICLLTDTAHVTITVTDSIQVATSPDIELCTPIEINLMANSFGTASYFIWSDDPNFSDTLNTNLADSVLTITPSQNTTYYVISGNPGCSHLDSVVVTFIGSDIVLNGDSTLCLGESSIITVTNLNPSISFVYVWGPPEIIVGSPNPTTVIIAPTTTQYIYVTASASNGCVVQDSMLISVSDIPSSSVIASATEYTIAEGGTTTLLGQPSGYSYQWTPAAGLISPTSQNTDAQVDQTTIYTLSVSDGICTKSDTVQIKVFEFICGQPFIFIPNAFTPNGDNENDVLYVRGVLIQDMIFRVFDRWGELVFESNDRLIGWDGTFRGKNLDPDVYDYYLKAVCIDGEESIIKGNVTLMR